MGILSQARQEWREGAETRPRSPDRTVKAHERAATLWGVDEIVRYSGESRRRARIKSRVRSQNDQIMMRQQELRRDVEAIFLFNQSSQEDDGAAVPGLLGGLPAWLTTSTSRGAAGADGGFNFTTGIVDAATPGAARALTETLVRQIAGSVWEEGADPTILMSVPAVIAGFSQFMFDNSSRIARLQRQTEAVQAGVAIGYVDIFLSDFNVSLEFVPNRLQQTAVDSGSTQVADLFIISPAWLMQGFLQGYEVQPLAREGTADNRQMTVDVTLKVLNEAAHGVVADIDPTLAVTA